jgi:hypothetical protein
MIGRHDLQLHHFHQQPQQARAAATLPVNHAVVTSLLLETVIMSALGSFFAITVALTLIVCHDDGPNVTRHTEVGAYLWSVSMCLYYLGTHVH